MVPVGIAGHLERLNASPSPLGGIEALLVGLIAEDDSVRALGCMGVGKLPLTPATARLMMIHSGSLRIEARARATQ